MLGLINLLIVLEEKISNISRVNKLSQTRDLISLLYVILYHRNFKI